MRVCISQPICGVTINGREFIVGDDHRIQWFCDEATARQFMANNSLEPTEYDYIGEGDI